MSTETINERIWATTESCMEIAGDGIKYATEPIASMDIERRLIVGQSLVATCCTKIAVVYQYRYARCHHIVRVGCRFCLCSGSGR